MDVLKGKDAEEGLPSDDKETTTSQNRESFLQRLVGPKLFTIHATLIIAFRTMCYGYLSGILTTLERRFQLSSSEAGTLIIVNDIAELCFIVIASHFGHKSHRPRWVALGSLTMGLGMFITAIPHFSSDPLDPKAVILGISDTSGFEFDTSGRNIDNFGLCTYAEEQTDDVQDPAYEIIINTTADSFSQFESFTTTYLTSKQPFNESTLQCERSSSNLGPVAWIVIGQIITGIGSAPMFPLIMSYIDDSVDRVKYTSYTACIFMSFAIGPPLGLLMAAWTSSFYVDFNRIANEDIPDLPLEDPRWIGAWWVGLVVCFVGLEIVGFPMYFYPRSMAGRRQIDEKKAGKGEAKADDELMRKRARKKSRGNSIFERTTQVKGLIHSVKRLITNIPLTMLCVGASAELAMIGIFGSFGIKYMQTQFSLSASAAANIFGGILVPVSILANIVSAYITRRYHFNVRRCSWFLVVLVSLSVPFIPIVMAVGCSNSEVAGVNVEYSTSSMDDQRSMDQSDNICNKHCRCPEEIFQPVCGANAVTYISPCHAGCATTSYANSMTNETIYSDCSCIGESAVSNNTATSGQCETECSASKLIVFILMSFVILFFMSSILTPSAYIIMRIVHDRDRSIAVGWKVLVTKCLGYFPAPVYFGAIINSTCTLWQYSCGERGSCWLYDIVSYRHAFFGTLLGLRCTAILCYLIMIWFLEDDYQEDMKEDKDRAAEELPEKIKETDVDGPSI